MVTPPPMSARVVPFNVIMLNEPARPTDVDPVARDIAAEPVTASMLVSLSASTLMDCSPEGVAPE